MSTQRYSKRVAQEAVRRVCVHREWRIMPSVARTLTKQQTDCPSKLRKPPDAVTRGMRASTFVLGQDRKLSSLSRRSSEDSGILKACASCFATLGSVMLSNLSRRRRPVVSGFRPSLNIDMVKWPRPHRSIHHSIFPGKPRRGLILGVESLQSKRFWPRGWPHCGTAGPPRR